MTASVTTEQQPMGDGHTDVVVLTTGTARAELWPSHGFNCLRWSVDGVDVLYTAPDWATNPVPTRSGIPVLFPFPNRIRAGRFTWAGRDYELPLNDSTKQNAIHGFTPRRAWRVAETSTHNDSARVVGEFLGSREAADAQGLWPADYLLRLTYTLEPRLLRLRADVTNPDTVALPFGLGFHPYFRRASGDDRLSVAANGYWELQESLPTGTILPVQGPSDLRSPRRMSELTLDDVYTTVDGPTASADLTRRALLERTDGHSLELACGSDYREYVLFTPPHRQAVALEPYTCTTDAIHLQQRGVDAGWRVLEPGASWSGTFEMRWM